jgi:hypothetical protein
MDEPRKMCNETWREVKPFKVEIRNRIVPRLKRSNKKGRRNQERGQSWK